MSEHDRGSRALTPGQLDRLLGILALEDGPHPDLSPRIVDDYIRGRASDEERSLMESAMASSSGLREEVLALAAIARRGAEFEALEPPPAPPRRGPQVVVNLTSPRTWKPRRSTLLAFCGLAALGVVLWFLSPLSPRSPGRKGGLYAVTFDRTLTDEQFETGVQRTPGGAPPLPAATNRRDAAMLSLFRAIEWRDGHFETHPVPPETGGASAYRLTLDLDREGGTIAEPLDVLLPAGATEPQTAILTFPDLALHWVESTAWAGRVALPQRSGQSLFLVVTYRLGDRYRASAPVVIPPA